jgi:hypothetical protein
MLVGLLLRNGLGPTACVPHVMSPFRIGRCGTLRVTIFAVVKTVLGFCRHTKRSAKAITLYIGATAKWARIKFGVTHDSNPALLARSPGARGSDVKSPRASCIAVCLFAGSVVASYQSAAKRRQSIHLWRYRVRKKSSPPATSYSMSDGAMKGLRVGGSDAFSGQCELVIG